MVVDHGLVEDLGDRRRGGARLGKELGVNPMAAYYHIPNKAALLDAVVEAVMAEIDLSVDDPNLPAGQVDLLLMVDVYHEFSHPESMLWGIRRSLKPTGVVALLEYREEDPDVPIKPLHKMSKRQIMKEYEQNGFKLVREYNRLPWQHLMFFARDPDWTAPQFSTRQDQ